MQTNKQVVREHIPHDRALNLIIRPSLWALAMNNTRNILVKLSAKVRIKGDHTPHDRIRTTPAGG